MLNYLIRRLLWMVPTLLAIALFSFWISIEAPGDPVERLMQFSDDGSGSANRQRTEELKQEWRARLGIDKPLFYWTIRSSKTSFPFPVPDFHGTNNQFHFWLGNAVRGDFGYSYSDGEAVGTKLWPKLRLSFLLTTSSLLLAFLISVPIGVFGASRPDGFFDRSSALVLFMLYSLPTFFVGTLLLLTFSNPDVLYWFPSAGLQNPITFDPEWSLGRKIQHWAPHLVLPFITFTYGSLAYLSRIARSGLAEEQQKDYITTARAKGLSERKVLWKHSLRNALLPLITVIGQVFPITVGGSVIIETIFTLPGIGWEAYRAILNYDYPVIVAIFTLGGLLTVVGYIVADLLYAWADPRIRYDR
jgi:peptide/nickel transport system permease protein